MRWLVLVSQRDSADAFSRQALLNQLNVKYIGRLYIMTSGRVRLIKYNLWMLFFE